MKIPGPMSDRALEPVDQLAMESAALLYVVAIAATAQCSGWHYVLFPAVAALSHDVLTRPWGKWATQPIQLVIVPTLAAGIGTLIAQRFGYHVWTVLLVVALCLFLLAAVKSNIAPAIAAGMLPLVLGITNWRYPASVMLGLAALVLLLLAWRRYCETKYRAVFDNAKRGDLDELPEKGLGTRWILPYFLFLAIMALGATASGLRLILFPPLAVIAYEMFAHPKSCPWAQKSGKLPVACLLTSTAGWLCVSVFGNSGVAAGCSMAAGIVVLRILQIRMPPALAVGILPLIIKSADIKYPIAVGIGATALMLAFLLYRRWLVDQGRTDRNGSKI